MFDYDHYHLEIYHSWLGDPLFVGSWPFWGRWFTIDVLDCPSAVTLVGCSLAQAWVLIFLSWTCWFSHSHPVSFTILNQYQCFYFTIIEEWYESMVFRQWTVLPHYEHQALSIILNNKYLPLSTILNHNEPSIITVFAMVSHHWTRRECIHRLQNPQRCVLVRNRLGEHYKFL